MPRMHEMRLKLQMRTDVMPDVMPDVMSAGNAGHRRGLCLSTILDGHSRHAMLPS